MSAPSLGVRDGGLSEQLERDVVVNTAVAQHAAVAVRRVLAQADVRDQRQIGYGEPQGAQRHLHDPLVVVGRRGGLVLVIGQPEQDHRRHAGRVNGRASSTSVSIE